MFLIRERLYKIEIGQACAGQIKTHKRKLNARKVFKKEALFLLVQLLTKARKSVKTLQKLS
jgi:hypothetical protein